MYETIVNDIKKYLESPQINEFIRMDLHLLRESILKAKKDLDGESFKLVFIGPSCAGKTTIISSIFGMYFYDDNNELIQVMHSDKGGRTTPCTIEIIPCDETRVDITPKNINEITGIISEYCHFITRQGGSVPEEIRSIINGRLSKGIRDTLRKSNNVSEAISIVASELNVDNLNMDILQLRCIGKGRNEKFKHINRLLEQVRKGELENFVIPDKIEIYIEREYLNVPNGISRVIDTRGISSETAKYKNCITAREDLDNYIKDDNSFVIYVNQFSSIENPVVDFYFNKLTSLRTNPEDLVRFMVLINIRDGSIESKVKNVNEVDEYLNDKRLEFENAVLLSDNDELLNTDKIKEKYISIKEIISQAKGDVANFIFYESLVGMIKVNKSGEDHFIVESQEDCIKNRGTFSTEIEKVIFIRNKIIKERLDSDVKVARMYISNEIRLSSNTALGNMITDFEKDIRVKTKTCITDWIYKYFTDLVNQTRRMDGRTIAAYVRGNGYVVSRNETIVDDIYYWHNNFKRDLEEKLEMVLESETALFEEKSIVFKDYMTGVEAINVLRNKGRGDIQAYADNIADQLIDGLRNNLVGNTCFWNNVQNGYSTTYAAALYSVVSRIFNNQHIDTTNQKLISQQF